MWKFYCVLVLAVRSMTNDDTKIVGGQKYDLKNVPFLVNLQDDWTPICGASLMTLSHVLTACHCLTDHSLGMGYNEIEQSKSKELTAVAGTDNIRHMEPSAQIRDVIQILLHPKCSYEDEPIMLYDYAVGLTDEPFTQSPKVNAVRIPMDKAMFDKDTKALVGGDKQCFVAGWGATTRYPERGKVQPSITLKAVQMKVIPDSECGTKLAKENKKFEGYDFAAHAQMCGVSAKEKDASDCTGDSGGPFFCDSQIYGIVSYGFECGESNTPNVYAKVSYAVDWIGGLGIKGVENPSKTLDQNPRSEEEEGQSAMSGQEALFDMRMIIIPLLMFGVTLAMA